MQRVTCCLCTYLSLSLSLDDCECESGCCEGRVWFKASISCSLKDYYCGLVWHWHHGQVSSAAWVQCGLILMLRIHSQAGRECHKITTPGTLVYRLKVLFFQRNSLWSNKSIWLNQEIVIRWEVTQLTMSCRFSNSLSKEHHWFPRSCGSGHRHVGGLPFSPPS